MYQSNPIYKSGVTGSTQILQENKANKLKQIKDMNFGDSILNVHTDSLEETSTNIKHYFSTHNQQLSKLTTESNNILVCTLDYYLLVRYDIGFNKKFGWKSVDLLTVGTEVLLRRGRNDFFVSPIRSIKKYPSEIVYDITTVSYNNTLIANEFIISNRSKAPKSFM